MEACCAERVDGANAERPGYGSTGFQITEDERISLWGSERDPCSDAGCGSLWGAMECCFANEELSWTCGAWGSSSCLGELRDLQGCVQEKVVGDTSYD